MKRACFIGLLLLPCLTATFLLSQSHPVALININSSARVASSSAVSPVSASQADPEAQAKILDQYGKLPLSFEANRGQADGRVRFLSRTGGYTLFLTGDEAVLALRGRAATKPAPEGASVFGGATVSLKRHPDTNPYPTTPQSMTGGVLRMKLRNANAAAKITGTDELAGTSNYFIGNDPTKWQSAVPTYAKVRYEGIYSGIDLVYYGNQRQLEYDFIVAPGADPRRIAFDVSGAKRIRRDAHGDLVLKMATGENEIRWHKPLVYQEKDGTRQEIAARYAITDTNRVGFEVAKYDTNRPLYIDPLIYSTYLGGSGADRGAAIAVDSAGNAYVTGWTQSTDFPTRNPLQAATGGGNSDAFVTKLNSTGTALIYSTYLGGNGNDAASGIAVDSAGNAYVVGGTGSTNFPVTPGAFQTVCNGGSGCATYADAFVAKISPAGSALVYSTYLGGSGSESGQGIAVDSAGNAFVTGQTLSTDFPTINALQSANGGGADAFVAKINPAGSALVYSTYLGGSGTDYGTGIAVDSVDNAYVTGTTGSTNFPTMNPLQPANGGGSGFCPHCDAFATKINPAGSALVYSTYLGGNGDDHGSGIAVDSAGNAYVTGVTGGNFPTKNPFQPTNGGNNAFVSEINPTGSDFVYSSFLGGFGADAGHAIAVDNAGSAYVTGLATSLNFPTTPGAFQTRCKRLRELCDDAFLSRINPSGSALIYSTYLGGVAYDEGDGIAVDNSGHAYVVGYTESTDFPVKNPFQSIYAGGGDALVTEIQMLASTTTLLTSSPNPSGYGQAVTFTATVTSYLGALPDGETVTFISGSKILGTTTLTNGSASFTTSTLKAGPTLVTAVYRGDSTFGSSTSKAVKQVVHKATTTTTLASSQNPSNLGQSVTFTATVTPQFGGKVTGAVTFYDGTTAVKTVAVSGGVAKFTTSTLTSGAHTITATYNGSTSFTGSSASLTQTVN